MIELILQYGPITIWLGLLCYGIGEMVEKRRH